MLSESEEDSDTVLHGADPIFSTKEELDQFIASCNIQKGRERGSEDWGRVCFDRQSKIKKDCTCGQCSEIWYGDFEHICCQQVER